MAHATPSADRVTEPALQRPSTRARANRVRRYGIGSVLGLLLMTGCSGTPGADDMNELHETLQKIEEQTVVLNAKDGPRVIEFAENTVYVLLAERDRYNEVSAESCTVAANPSIKVRPVPQSFLNVPYGSSTHFSFAQIMTNEATTSTVDCRVEDVSLIAIAAGA